MKTRKRKRKEIGKEKLKERKINNKNKTEKKTKMKKENVKREEKEKRKQEKRNENRKKKEKNHLMGRPISRRAPPPSGDGSQIHRHRAIYRFRRWAGRVRASALLQMSLFFVLLK